ncbi:MAG: hypothetical protein M1820_005426 [Bogoriella megaspora]|nr:MAG: hypothetical protein M1820_005426 [Bogoriella megaspora]
MYLDNPANSSTTASISIPNESMPRSARLKSKSLSHGRPPLTSKSQPSLSSKKTRTLIRSHHRLSKLHAQALRNGDTEAASQAASQITQNGGLNIYQQASIAGQSNHRGGDSSKVLIEWLHELLPSPSSSTPASSSRNKDSEPTLNMLEVGCLSPRNACSQTSIFGYGDGITKIDLHSQHPSILEQDFMQRPLPQNEEERFDVLSLSLVLNYVGSPEERGEMLRRCGEFLRRGAVRGIRQSGEVEKVLPYLFLVLPAPCVANSRYLTEERLEGIMEALGYVKVRRKMSAKLVYYLWRFDGGREAGGERGIGKMEVNPGKNRNNFCVVLKSRGK